jgi:hypothetical protein
MAFDAAYQILLQQGIRVPEDVPLMCDLHYSLVTESQ